MVSAMVVLLFLGVLQIAFAMFTKNVVQDAASQGARYGALLDRQPEDGGARAIELLYSVLPDSYQADVTTVFVKVGEAGGCQAASRSSSAGG